MYHSFLIHSSASLVFLRIAILTDMRRTLTVALMCISLMSGDLEHHFMYLLAIWSCLENCELSSSAHILPGLFGLFVIELNEIMCIYIHTCVYIYIYIHIYIYIYIYKFILTVYQTYGLQIFSPIL